LFTEILYKSYEYEDGGDWLDTEENGGPCRGRPGTREFCSAVRLWTDRAILIVLDPPPPMVHITERIIYLLFRGQMSTVCTAHQEIKLHVMYFEVEGRTKLKINRNF